MGKRRGEGRVGDETVAKPETARSERGQPLTPAQRELVDQHLGLVRLHLRRRVRTRGQPHRDRERDDLYQEGCLALMRAAARYDPRRHGAFPAFALPRIRGRIHAALHHAFSLIHVPLALAAKKDPVNHESSAPDSAYRPRPRVQPLPDEAFLVGPPAVATSHDHDGAPIPLADSTQGQVAEPQSIRHAIRRRFERAVDLALSELTAARWRQRDPTPIMRRLAAERLLVGDAAARTPLRRIAREAGISSGRACAYERRLQAAVADHLAADPRMPALLRLADRNPDGFDGRLDAAAHDVLVEAEVEAFSRGFTALDPIARAIRLYALVEQAGSVDEVARNLYRLNLKPIES